MKKVHTPNWTKHAIFYQIFPDRFAKSRKTKKPSRLEAWDSPPTVHGYKGGDLYGVIEKLDYLQDLGITALYFNPIFQSASNHRYHTYDYYKVDPLLGGNEALKALLDQCHKRKMKVVLDGVFNHSSRGFFQFHDVLENKKHSPYHDWFHIHKFPLNAYLEKEIGYEAWWGLAALPKFNTANPEVREFLFSVAEFWLRFGIDGWRLDVPNEINDDAFWQEFRRRCRKINPECYIVGEMWNDAERYLKGDQFDAVMNYPLTRAIFGVVGQKLNHEQISKCGYVSIPKLSIQEFADQIEFLLQKHHPAITNVQLNLLGSHDTPRALTVLNGDENALRIAYMFLFSFVGVPCLYYGDELGLFGDHDPHCRQSMSWDREFTWNHSLRDYIKTLIQLRHRHHSLQEGNFKTLYAKDSVYIYARQLRKESVLGVLNLGENVDCNFEISNSEGLEGQYVDLLGVEVGLELKNTTLSGSILPAQSSFLLIRGS